MKIEKIKCGLYDALHIEVADKYLDYIPERAQIIKYGVVGKPDVIWGNPDASFRPQHAIRSGVPICWPWFSHLELNPTDVQHMHSRDMKAVSHGFARTIDWKNHSLQDHKDYVTITNSLNTSSQLTPEWPHEAELKLTIIFGESLTVKLEVQNNSDQQLAITQALHNYFFVSDVRQVEFEGLEGLKYVEQNHDGIQNEPPKLNGPIDRVYLNIPKELSIIDPEWKRKIIIETLHSNSAVLWTPWEGPAGTLDQFPEQLWNQVVCLEIGSLLKNMQIVKPKTNEYIEMTIKIADAL